MIHLGVLLDRRVGAAIRVEYLKDSIRFDWRIEVYNVMFSLNPGEKGLLPPVPDSNVAGLVVAYYVALAS